jgi:Integrase core domain
VLAKPLFPGVQARRRRHRGGPKFHKTMLNGFYRVAFRKKLYARLEELQANLDAWLTEYNEARPHQGRWCYGKTPMQTFVDSVPLAKEKLLVAVSVSECMAVDPRPHGRRGHRQIESRPLQFGQLTARPSAC